MSHDYNKFKFADDSCEIRFVKRSYCKKSGKWVETKVETEIVSPQFYENYITAIPWFANFGWHSSCRASWRDTPLGKLPVIVKTISPWRDTRTIAEFHFKRKV